MNTEAQRVAIAEACGWTDCKRLALTGNPPGVMQSHESKRPLPDYLNSLDAMHEAEKVLTTREQQADYSRCLIEVLNRDLRNEPRFIGPSSFDQSHVTAAQRAEAFLRTLGLWIES